MKEKVSIIIPVYKVDLGLVENCLISISKQTFRDFKVYLVDDGNEKEYREQLLDIANQYECICLKHESNKGLFQARITGVEASDSKYVLFVDPDDTITVDWLRLLVVKAKDTSADIVMGRTICVDENGWRFIRNRNNSLYNRNSLYGDKILEMLMKDEGMDFSIHTVWNKLYSRELWEKAIPFLKQCNKHLIMTEDILFSTVLFYYAKKMTFSNHDGYFYYRNSNSSTINTDGLGKAKKNVADLIYAFSNVKLFLEEQNIFDKYETNYVEWKNRYFRWWSYNINKYTNNKNQEALKVRKTFLEFFDKKDFELAKTSDGYFDDAKTTWNSKLEEIKETLCSEKYKVVSFDLFDTLVTRPVLHPEDVFEVISHELPVDNSEKNRFIQIRQAAERYARKISNIECPGSEDITIDDIYAVMHTKFGVSKENTEFLKEKEIGLETEFAQCRETGKELFELAKYLGKVIIITSDMYLRRGDIEKILEKNQYFDIEKLYLSSEIKLLKSTGNLFEYVLDDMGVEADEVIHIGDNWESDYIISNGKGIKGVFLPKTKDILFNTLGDTYTGNSIGDAIDNSNSIIDLSKHLKNLAVRNMYAVAANKLYDNPFCSFNEYSNYNGDPYLLGFLPLGMHMYGLANWVIKKAIENGYTKVHFTSRDGYYLMRSYEILRQKYYHNAPEANYVSLSRKSLIPIEVCHKGKVLDIIGNIAYSAHSPKSIIEMYHTVLKPLTEDLKKEYLKNGIVLKKRFASEDECIMFLQIMSNLQYDEKKANEQYRLCRNYLQQEIGENEVIFDLGYSGKLHKYIVEALGYNVAGLYLHNNGYEALMRMNSYDLNIESYYNFIPTMSGVIYEYFFSEYGPSCIGYEQRNKKICPVFEEPQVTYEESYVLAEVHRASEEFLNAFLDSFVSHINILQVQEVDTTLQFEKVLMHIKDFDKIVFSNCYIEDEYYGGIKKRTITDIWNWQVADRKCGYKEIIQHNEVIPNSQNIEYDLYLRKVRHGNLLKKALYWMVVDRTFFRRRIKEYLKREKFSD